MKEQPEQSDKPKFRIYFRTPYVDQDYWSLMLLGNSCYAMGQYLVCWMIVTPTNALKQPTW